MGNTLLMRCPLCRRVGSHEVVRTEPAEFVEKVLDSTTDEMEKFFIVNSNARVRVRTCEFCGEEFETREIPEDMLYEAYIPRWMYADLKKRGGDTQQSTSSDEIHHSSVNAYGGTTFMTSELVALMHRGFTAADALKNTEPTKSMIIRNLAESLLSVIAIVIRHRTCILDPEMTNRISTLEDELKSAGKTTTN